MPYPTTLILLSLSQLLLGATANPTTPTTALLPTFVLKLAKPQVTFNNVPLDGTYGQLDTGDGPLVGFNGANRSNAVVLSLNSARNLVIDQLGIIGYQDPGQTEELLHFESAEEVQANGGIPAVCDVGSGVLKCKAAKGNKHLVLCPGEAVMDDLFLVDAIEEGCFEVKLKVVLVK